MTTIYKLYRTLDCEKITVGPAQTQQWSGCCGYGCERRLNVPRLLFVSDITRMFGMDHVENNTPQ